MKKLLALIILSIFLLGAAPPSKPPLVVKEADGSPSVQNVREIRVTNSTLTNVGGGVVSVATGGGTVTGTGTNHYWPFWSGTSSLGSKSITASKPICSDASGDPAVCAGTEGVWQAALTRPVTGPTSPTANSLVKFTGAGQGVDNAGAILGTLTNTYLCKYTAAGTLLSCDVDPATYATAANWGGSSGSPPNIGLTAVGIGQFKLNEMNVSATGNISAQQCSGSIVNNFGQANDAAPVLPAAAAGLNCTFILGTTVAKYYRVTAGAGDKIYLDGVAGSDTGYVGVASATIGYALSCLTFQTGASAYDWYCAGISGPWVAAGP
jgi:hypothetical protein